jgi:hypothetical protein
MDALLEGSPREWTLHQDCCGKVKSSGLGDSECWAPLVLQDIQTDGSCQIPRHGATLYIRIVDSAPIVDLRVCA